MAMDRRSSSPPAAMLWAFSWRSGCPTSARLAPKVSRLTAGPTVRYQGWNEDPHRSGIRRRFLDARRAGRARHGSRRPGVRFTLALGVAYRTRARPRGGPLLGGREQSALEARDHDATAGTPCAPARQAAR